jgi:hypothetical protein
VSPVVTDKNGYAGPICFLGELLGLFHCVTNRFLYQRCYSSPNCSLAGREMELVGQCDHDAIGFDSREHRVNIRSPLYAQHGGLFSYLGICVDDAGQFGLRFIQNPFDVCLSDQASARKYDSHSSGGFYGHIN